MPDQYQSITILQLQATNVILLIVWVNCYNSEKYNVKEIVPFVDGNNKPLKNLIFIA